MMKSKNKFDFKARCTAMLVSLGAEVGGKHERLTLQTVAGPLAFTPHEDWLACKFDDAKRAKELIHHGSLNPYSGKWNWMYTKPTLVDLKDLFGNIVKVLEPPPEDKYVAFVAPNDSSLVQPSGAPRQQLNTRIRYMYRDADNYKVTGSVVVSGTRFWDRKGVSELQHCCDDFVYFVPGQVGLPDLQDSFAGCESEWDDERDHPFHELLSLEATADEPTETISVHDLCVRFVDVLLGDGWRDDYRPGFYAQMKARHDERVAKEEQKQAASEH